ncbi:ceramidase domain-containing protein [Palleronia sp. KMU-117]|uniref:ceramidase domain-containing protein n=1 Tax=Palleronia sp. KMU-117 TaxID=3434108 RepID=UPI003D706725
MDWTQAIDAYCERTDPSFWSEPVNALTNAAFLIAAAVMVRRVRGQGLPIAMALVAILAAIGIGSFLFHTVATPWAALADSLPIALYILVYLFAANLHFWNWPLWGAILGTLAFFPYAALTVPLFQSLPFFVISAGYWPVPLLIAVYGVLLRHRAPGTARGLLIGAAILTLSLVLRSLDEPLCTAIPVGTHFWWHILNAIMLGWMIEVYRRHRLAHR